jgi:hypothetical protein
LHEVCGQQHTVAATNDSTAGEGVDNGSGDQRGWAAVCEQLHHQRDLQVTQHPASFTRRAIAAAHLRDAVLGKWANASGVAVDLQPMKNIPEAPGDDNGGA